MNYEDEHDYDRCTYPDRQAEHSAALAAGRECPACGQQP